MDSTSLTHIENYKMTCLNRREPLNLLPELRYPYTERLTSKPRIGPACEGPNIYRKIFYMIRKKNIIVMSIY